MNFFSEYFVIPLICSYTWKLGCSYLIAAMGLQVIWSFGLAVLDTFALVRKKTLLSPVLVSLFVVGDWVSLSLSLSN